MKYFIVGPEKCGTSWIDKALRLVAPETLPVVTKETFYFDRHYDLGKGWHDSLFQSGVDYRGEVSPSYFSSELAPHRIYSEYPDAKIIIVLRDPYKRMESHLQHLSRRGRWTYSEGFLDIPDEVWSEARNSSLYEKHVATWKKTFGEKRVLVVDYEDIQKDPVSLIKTILEHIGLESVVDAGSLLELSRDKVYAARQPRNQMLSRLAYRASRILQNFGLIRVAEFLRRSKLRNILEKKEGAPVAQREALQKLIQKREDFSNEVDFYMRSIK